MILSHYNVEGKCNCPITGTCGECGADYTDHDLIGHGTEQDGLGSWPKFWCNICINKHWGMDFGSGEDETVFDLG